jgi:ketosteroid isomerase-like protein
MPTPVEVMREYIQAMQRGDREAAFAHYADDIVAHVPGRSTLAGTRAGKDAVVEYIRTVIELAHDVELELIDMLSGDEHVALLVRERLHGRDGDLDIRRANVYRVRDGQISEIRIFEADQYAVDEFLARTLPG